ncbi:MAG: protein translocase subunit SecF [Gammaproteobacteria bacterium]|nr:MAG: protein translocase subunit SecF [Gammaproteobacteria bacterium]
MKFRIDFMKQRRPALILSSVLMLIAILSLAFRGLALGIDFTGGTVIEVAYPKPMALEAVRKALREGGFERAVVQHFGTPREVLIRLGEEGMTSAELSTRILNLLQKASRDNPPELRRVEYVGPQVGRELAEKGGLAVLFALIGILIYVALRFEYRFALGSVAALVHDVIITLGVFSLFQIEFDLTVLAAILAVIGYSLNDTIVVFDRIRENFRKMRKGTPVDIVNVSINQTLTRTLMTSLTTLLVLLALFFFGGEIIHAFALALIVGIVVGTYSSIYVASAAALALGVSRADLLPPKKEGV